MVGQVVFIANNFQGQDGDAGLHAAACHCRPLLWPCRLSRFPSHSRPCWLMCVASWGRPAHRSLKSIPRQGLSLSLASARVSDVLMCWLIRRAPFCVALVWNIRGAGLLTASGYGPGFPTVWFHAMRLQSRCDRASMVFWYHCLYETVGGGRYNPDTSPRNSVTVCQGMFE